MSTQLAYYRTHVHKRLFSGKIVSLRFVIVWNKTFAKPVYSITHCSSLICIAIEYMPKIRLCSVHVEENEKIVDGDTCPNKLAWHVL